MLEALLRSDLSSVIGAFRAVYVMRLYPVAPEATIGRGLEVGKLTPVTSPI